MKQKKTSIRKTLIWSAMICILIINCIPEIINAEKQTSSEHNQQLYSPAFYDILMFGRIFCPHIEEEHLCFQAINVVCLIYDNYGSFPSWRLHYSSWFEHIKIPTYYLRESGFHTSRRIFVNTPANDLPEFEF